MLTKKHVAVALVALAAVSFQPAPVHAGFFLFNIIQDIFGGHKSAQPPPKPPTAAANGSLVKLGMRGSQVAALQQRLIAANYLGGKADGIFGYQTLEAVRAFQRDNGLAADGVAGPRTLTTLAKTKAKPKPKATPPRPPRRPPPDNGVPHYLYTLPVLATAYTATDEGCTGITYGGNVLRRGMVAVDPDIIPLGTRLYVPGYGEAIADDIGGAIIGNHIDLAMETKEEAFDWGAKQVTAYILSERQ